MQPAAEEREADRGEHVGVLLREPALEEGRGDRRLPVRLLREFATGQADVRVDDALAIGEGCAVWLHRVGERPERVMHEAFGVEGVGRVADRGEEERKEGVVFGEEHLFFVAELAEEGARRHAVTLGDRVVNRPIECGADSGHTWIVNPLPFG